MGTHTYFMDKEHKGFRKSRVCFLAYLKQVVPNILSVGLHCVIHRQHLVAKNLSECLHGSLHYVIRAVKKTKSNALNNRLFAQLCLENYEDYICLLLHTQVCWINFILSLIQCWNSWKAKTMIYGSI